MSESTQSLLPPPDASPSKSFIEQEISKPSMGPRTYTPTSFSKKMEDLIQNSFLEITFTVISVTILFEVDKMVI